MLIDSLLAWNQLDSTFEPAEESLCFPKRSVRVNNGAGQ